MHIAYDSKLFCCVYKDRSKRLRSEKVVPLPCAGTNSEDFVLKRSCRRHALAQTVVEDQGSASTKTEAKDFVLKKVEPLPCTGF